MLPNNSYKSCLEIKCPKITLKTQGILNRETNNFLLSYTLFSRLGLGQNTKITEVNPVSLTSSMFLKTVSYVFVVELVLKKNDWTVRRKTRLNEFKGD